MRARTGFAASAVAFAAFGAFGASFARSSTAHAGGLEMPDNGTEALGRGGAFTAKADDPTAIHHNVGGLAQQRGSRVLVNANVAQSSLSFQREGVYAGNPGDPATPWAGKAYPRADNQGTPSILPFIAATSDLGIDNSRLTLALGTFPPHAVGGRVYPIVNSGMPGPARYDQVGGLSNLILFHTAAAGYRLTENIDIGVAVHVVQASIALRMVSYVDRVGDVCKTQPETPSCDAQGQAVTTGWSGTGSIGALIRPGGGIGIGLNVRGPTYLQTEGVAKLSPPSSMSSLELDDSRVLVKTQLPWVFRAGVRKAFGRRPADPTADAHARVAMNEIADVEVDVTYETWGSAMDPGPKIYLEKMGPLGPMEKTSHKHYKDTFSVRAGSSYTTDALGTPITLRGGAYYDASATDPAYTRLDADTLTKVAATAGAGVRLGPVKLDAAYASVFDISRTVTEGALRSSTGDVPAVNEGTFRGHTHIASIGALVELDILIGGRARLPRANPGADRVAATRSQRAR